MSVDVANAIGEWREKLLDLSKRNRLINCRTGGRTGGVSPEHPEFADFWTRLVIAEEPQEFPWKQYLLGGSEELATDEEEAAIGEEEQADDRSGAGESDITSSAQVRAEADATKAASVRAELEACLVSPDLAGNHILTALTDKLLAGRLQRLALATQTAMSEQGVNILYLAFGFLRWFESKDSDEALLSPLLLVPVRLHRPSLDAAWQLLPSEEEVVPNHSLIQMLSESFEINLPQLGDDIADRADGLAGYLAAVREAIGAYSRWRVEERAFLATFSFQKIAMWKDLGKNGEKIANHSMCRALAGEREQHDSIVDVPSARDLDDAVAPRDTFHILESDSSQHEAIEAAKRGLSLVLDGPPGTGKSQTIANIIAEFIAQGKTVLFVSEKSAALEVVKRRLDQSALGDFCLECHSHKVNKKVVIEELGRCLGLSCESHPTADRQLDELAEVRQRLNAYVRALHRPQGALDVSPFAIHGRLARLHPASATRCPVNNPLEMRAIDVERRVRALESFVEAGPVLESRGRHPWQGSAVAAFSLTLEDDIRHHFQRLAAFLPEYVRKFEDLRALGFVGDTPTIRELASAIVAAKQAMTYPLVPARWFEVGAELVASAYIELHAEVEQYKHVRESASKYLDTALSADWGQWVPAIKGRGPVLAHLLGADPMLRQSINVIFNLVAALDDTAATVERLIEAVNRTTATVGGGKVEAMSVSDLTRLQKTAATMGAIGRLSPTWFETLRRRELREVAERGDREAVYLSGERRALDHTFQPAAFDEDALKVLEQSQHYRSFLRRLMPGWRRHRGALAALYNTGAIPQTPKALLSSAERLAAYHQRRARLLRLGRDHQGELLATEQGVVDWESVLINLAHVEELISLRILPETMFPELVARRVDQDISRANADDLASKLAAFEARRTVMKDQFDLDLIGELQDNGKPITVERVAAWIREVSIPVRSLAEALSGLSSVLKAEADVRLDECGSHADLCRRLSRHSERIARIFNDLKKVEEDWEHPEEGDWAPQAALAHWMVAFIRAHGGKPLPNLIAAATDEGVRQRLRASLATVEPLWDESVEESWQLLGQVFPQDRSSSVGIIIESEQIERLTHWLAERVADVARLREWVTYKVVRADLMDLGLNVLVNEIEDTRVAVSDSPCAFLVRFYRLWLDAAYQKDRALANFRAEDHETLISRFRALDEMHVRETYKRIRSRLLSATAARDDTSLAPASSELGVLRRELNKKRRHLALRQLFARIPSLLVKLKPCLMMSPLAVSTYLDSQDIEFDLVVFDEASQVRPHDAVCAVYRGKQLIVAGDQKQLPPTNFFERLTDVATTEESDDAENADGEELANYESILDVCSTLGLPRKRLRWHYRSHRESLIAFSNRHFYGDLVTFPSVFDVEGASGVSLRYIDKGRWQSGKNGGFNTVEARVTADMVMEHARMNPKQSLGVITMNQRQQTLLLEEIEKRRRRSPELEAFFDQKSEEAFFVKNLENVQGDERDIIFLSVGYGVDQSGKDSMNFGPLNKEGGERRLNVAVTRARSSLTVVSSIRSNYIDLSRTDKVGAKLLKAYLDFAERGIPALAAAVTEDGERAPDSEFEIEVADALRANGLDVRTQVGCSGFRIDLALADPKAPGRYVLGIECDGATYHNSATARDRDRLRQSILEEKGWQLCRIWSTDWVRDPAKQVARVMAEYERALQSPAPSPQVRQPTSAPRESPPETREEKTEATQKAVPHYNYYDIDEVKQAQIEELVRRILEIYGATDEGEVVTTVARHLGFSRTGHRISNRIEHVVRQMKRKSQLVDGGEGRIRIP